MNRLPLMVFVLLLIGSQTSQERVCKYKFAGTLCLKHCCGEPSRLSCRDSCDGVACSLSDDCGYGCCKDGRCTSRGCDTTTPWYVIAVPIIVIVLVLLFAVCRIWWIKNHQVTAIHPGILSIYMNKTLMWKLGLKARFVFNQSILKPEYLQWMRF